jgi:hypothetical protein
MTLHTVDAYSRLPIALGRLSIPEVTQFLDFLATGKNDSDTKLTFPAYALRNRPSA